MTATATDTAATIVAPVTDATLPDDLPDGQALGNEILSEIGAKATASLKRVTGKAEFTPRGWSMSGKVD
jgi:hypothetical protein